MKKAWTGVRWAIAVLGIMLFAVAIGCSGEPEVVEVPVEKVVEVEVVREVEVESSEVEALRKELEELKAAMQTSRAAGTTAPPQSSSTPASSAPGPTAAATPAATATPKPPSLYVAVDDKRFTDEFTQLQSLAFAEGISIKVGNLAPQQFQRRGRHDALYIVAAGQNLTAETLSAVRSFVSTGGSAVIFLKNCDEPNYLDTLGVSCANIEDMFPKSRFRYSAGGSPRITFEGESFAPFWDGLHIDNGGSGCGTRNSICARMSELRAGISNEIECVARLQWRHLENSMDVCTALYGAIGDGNILILSRGPFFDRTSNAKMIWFEDDLIKRRDNEEAAVRLLRWLFDADAPTSRTVPSSEAPYSSFDAASILARFSTDDAVEGERRAAAVDEIIAQHQSGDVDRARAMDLMHIIAPELSIIERSRALEELAWLSEDDEWDAAETAEAVFYLASIITGDEPNPRERVAAAQELVERYESGDLDADTALNLMDTIAPDLSINERRQAAATLARLAAQDDWSGEDKMLAANETFRLVTGVPLAAEQRAGAAVDLTGMGIKAFDGGDSFDDRDIDNATELIKQAIGGTLTTDSARRILGLGD